MTNILAIDPSLSSTGWAVLTNDIKIINCGKITTKNKNSEDDRIFHISKYLYAIAKKYNIEIAIEESQFVHINKKTAMSLSRLRGGISTMLKLLNINILYKEPSVVKKVVTGQGNAPKEFVANVLKSLFKKDKIFAKIGPFNDKNNRKKTSDIYDAIAIGYTYLITNA